MTLQVYPTEIIPRPPPSQASIQQVPLQQSNVNQSGNEYSHQSSQMETDEQVIAYQREKLNKEWVDKSIQDGSIRCYPKSDLDLGRAIAGRAYGVVYKATMKHNRLTVATKTLYQDAHVCEEKFYKKLAKEVVY